MAFTINVNGKPLLRHLAEQALATNHSVTIVLGASKDVIRPAVADLAVQILQNDGWQEGMSCSIRLAANTITTDALLLMVCDQPHVTTAHLNALIEARNDSSIVASAYADTLGVPALFDRSMFGELAALGGQQGAKAVIRRHHDSALSPCRYKVVNWMWTRSRMCGNSSVSEKIHFIFPVTKSSTERRSTDS